MPEQKVTVNQLLSYMKAIRERLSELRSLRSSSQMRTTRFMGEEKIVEEALYDIKVVDKKITELETFLYLADSSIKQSNAITLINLEFDMKEMLAPLS